MEGTIRELSENIIEKVKEIVKLSDYKFTMRKPFLNLARRLLLLTPLFEEIRDLNESVPFYSCHALSNLMNDLEVTKKLLQHGSKGSKIYLVMEWDQIMTEYKAVATRLELELIAVSAKNLNISDEVKEQVALIIAQFSRARRQTYAPDVQLSTDLLSLYNKGTDEAADPNVLKRLVEKLQLSETNDLALESLALNQLIITSNGDPGETRRKMLRVLNLIKDFVQAHDSDSSQRENIVVATCARQGTIDKNHENTVVPNDYICPISLQLMQDPVIISTGQTFERSSIERWLQAGNGTCPKTQQILTNMNLTPNYVLRSLIAQWCETNGMEPMKRLSRPATSCTPIEHAIIHNLVQTLKFDPDRQHDAAGHIRLLAKRNAQMREAIAEAGAIPFLTNLLAAISPVTQEYAVTALLNLSICDLNKRRIVAAGAIPYIIDVLRFSNKKGRENAAAMLFSLSVTDDNKEIIGSCGGIAALVGLLNRGSEKGKKDATTALLNLCLFRGNKARAVRAGVVPTLMALLTEPQGELKDEALAILELLASHHEGKLVIGAHDGAVINFVKFLWSGSQMSQENAASILMHLFCGDEKHLEEARRVGVKAYLVDLQRYGSDRGKRKANDLLEMVTKHGKRQKQART